MAVISNLFGDSPFGILKSHADKVHECVNLLSDLFRELELGKPDRIRDIADRIMQLETEADQIQNELHERLASRVMIPVNKADLFNIVENQDSMADRAEEIAAILTYRPMTLPDDLMKEVKTFFEQVHRNCRIAQGITDKMDLLLESSFGERDSLTVSKLITELNQKEDRIKDQEIQLNRKLFSNEGSLTPVDLILWMKLIGLIADLSKFADRMAAGIRLILKNK